MKKIEIKKNNSNSSDKKGGIFGFLRGGASSSGSVTPGVIGGTASQASGGLMAAMAGKIASILVSVVVIGGITGVYMSRNADMGGASDSETMMASAQEAEAYVPAIQRSEAANEGKSSLGMFNETNKGSISFDIDPTLNNKGAGSANYDENADGYGDGLGSASSAETMAAEAMAGAAGESPTLNSGNLSSSFGDKSSRSMNMGASAPKLKPTFKSMASNKFKPMGNIKSGKGGQALAMSKANRASTVGTMRARSRSGARAHGQAKAMLSKMRESVGAKNYEASRAMTDAAWEGTTNEGEAAETVEAGGLGDGEGMTVEPIGSEGAKDNNNYEYRPASSFDASGAVNDTPWQTELNTINILFGIAMGLVMLAGACAEIKPYGYIGTAILAGLAAALCAVACGFAIAIMTKYGQNKLGGMWLGICGAGMIGCIAACWLGASAAATSTTALVASGVGVAMTIGNMLGGMLGDKTIDADAEKTKAFCADPKNKDHDGCYSQKLKTSLPYELSDSPVVRNNIA